MPRSFLVKKHQSSKKGNYGKLSSVTAETLCEIHKEPPQHSHIPTRHHCPASSPLHQHRTQSLSSSPLPLGADILHPPPWPNNSPHSLLGYSSETNRRDLTGTYKPVESCQKVDLETQQSSVTCWRRENLLPPSLPLLALFPAIPPGSSSSQGNFECLDCHEEHLSFPGLAKHKQLPCGWNSKKSFSCKYCEKEYVSLGALKMHIRTHTLPCVCKLCGKAFSRPWLLQGHIRTHTGEKPFTCFHCSRAFADRSNLRAHLQTHSEVKKYQCASCFKTFSRISLLAKHQEAGCPLC
ncbi:zinc finger protein SNAI2-like [Xyrichtys novacula]|uniref:Zinc finger protein SNAI2 n=1 Tax=Xyrichtys novacula TaxID=13765 RepID=A0AAV1FZM7_XYRNO|nr:zinc finger protein SNAI2-like [Xyrichtys novacula]